MNGIHDCGGMDGMGRVEVGKNEPVFQHDWEARVFGISCAADSNGLWNQDEYRHAIESRPALGYLQDSYYAKWLFGLESLLVKKGIATEEELAAGGKRCRPDAKLASSVLRREGVLGIINNGFSFRRDVVVAPRFSAGDQVMTRNINISGHTRLPRYARRKLGTILADHGVFSFNDSAANEHDERPQHVYSVRFRAKEIWGEEASEEDSLFLDLWDDHLDLASDQEDRQ